MSSRFLSRLRLRWLPLLCMALLIVAAGVPDAYRMPAFREQLSDAEIAQVLTYVRSTWGNHGEAIDAKAVGTLRGHTDPASASPIILQMR